MTHLRRPDFSTLGLAALLGAALLGCPGGGDSGSADGGTQDTGGESPGTAAATGALGSACADSCAQQDALGCPNALDADACEALCADLGREDESCQSLWVDLNRCMAEDDLICGIQGAPTTINLDCRAFGDEWDQCARDQAPPERDPLDDACARACLRIGDVRCPNDIPVLDCIDACVFAVDFDPCPEQWIALNECMADDGNMACDGSGHASTSDPDCLAIVEAWLMCE
jgi:hypothetical protein